MAPTVVHSSTVGKRLRIVRLALVLSPVRGRERDSLATYVLQLDEVSQVALARSLVEAPHAAIVAVADPASVCGHLVMADDYEEALGYAESFVRRGWRAAVWDIPTGPRSAELRLTHDGGGGE